MHYLQAYHKHIPVPKISLGNNVEFPQEINGFYFHKMFQTKIQNKNKAYMPNRENIKRLIKVR